MDSNFCERASRLKNSLCPVRSAANEATNDTALWPAPPTAELCHDARSGTHVPSSAHFGQSCCAPIRPGTSLLPAIHRASQMASSDQHTMHCVHTHRSYITPRWSTLPTCMLTCGCSDWVRHVSFYHHSSSHHNAQTEGASIQHRWDK